MLNQMQTARKYLNRYIDTAETISDYGLNLKMHTWGEGVDWWDGLKRSHYCDTACCMAGWAVTLANGNRYYEEDSEHSDDAARFADVTSVSVSKVLHFWRVDNTTTWRGLQGNSCIFHALFDSDAPNDEYILQRRAEWYMKRIDNLEEYNRVQSLPRKDRRQYQIQQVQQLKMAA